MAITQKPSKYILLSKPHLFERAQEIFKDSGVLVQMDGSKDTGVEVISTGTRHLGAAVGTLDFQYEYVQEKIKTWIECIKKLAFIANTEPHAAFTPYTHSLQCQWTFLCRTMPGNAQWFEPLEDAIRKIFIFKSLPKRC